MDRRRHYLISCLLFSLLWGVSTLSAQPSAPVGDEVHGLSFQTLLFVAGAQQSAEAKDNREIAPELPELFYFDGREYVPVVYPIAGLSDVYAYHGAPEMSFYSRSRNAEGEWVYRMLFSVQTEAEWRKVVIVLLPDYDEDKEFVAFPVNVTLESFGVGDILVYNLSNQDVIFNASGDVYPLYPLTPVEIDISKIKNNTLPVALALKEDSEFKLVYRRKWSMRPTIRGVYFLYTLNGDSRRWYMKNIIL